MRLTELSLGAQTAYAELLEQARTFETSSALSGLSGSFQLLERKGQTYWYFAFRDVGGKVRMSYVGPDDDRVRALVERFKSQRMPKALAPQAKAAIAQGCAPLAPKHFRIIKRLSDFGFFRAGGILVGTHAFVAYGNLLGVRWLHGAATLNVSAALPAGLKLDTHSSLGSLELGLLPRTEFQAVVEQLDLALEPLPFMEFSLESPTQACVFGNTGACVVNVPAPERYGIHKLIVHGERPVGERVKARKDLLQAASLAEYFLRAGRAAAFNEAWRDAIGRGKGWKSRAMEGKAALLAQAPELDDPALWRSR